MENKELQHWKDQCLHFQHAWEKTQVLLNNSREEIIELELACKQKDAAIEALNAIIAENRTKALDDLTTQAQELNMGY
jgi:ABC-type protease/lipase transport system fused ATPase/permease subunit